jgi:hypothetical protein
VVKLERIPAPLFKELLRRSSISPSPEKFMSGDSDGMREVGSKGMKTNTQQKGADLMSDRKLVPKVKIEAYEETIKSTPVISEPCLGECSGEAVLPRKKRKKKRDVPRDMSIDVIDLEDPALAVSAKKKHSFVSLLDTDDSSLQPPGKKACLVDLTLSSSPSSVGTASVIDLTLSDADYVDPEKGKMFDSPGTPPPRDPDLTPELVSRSKLMSTTQSSVKHSDWSGPRKPVYVRKTLFQFPAPSDKESTPPLERDRVTPTLLVHQEKSLGEAVPSSGDTEGVIMEGVARLGSVEDTMEVVARSGEEGGVAGGVTSEGEGVVERGGALIGNPGLDGSVAGGVGEVDKHVSPKDQTGLEHNMPMLTRPLQLDRSQPSWKATPINEVSIMMGMRTLSTALVCGMFGGRGNYGNSGCG